MTIYVLVILLALRGELAAAKAVVSPSLEACQETAALFAARKITALCVQVLDHEDVDL